MKKIIIFIILLLFVFTIGELNNTTQAQQTLDNVKEQVYEGLELISLIPILGFMFIILAVIAKVSEGQEIDMKAMFAAIVGIGVFALVIGVIVLAFSSV